MKNLFLLFFFIGFSYLGFAQTDNRPRYAQLRPIEILQLAATGGVSKIIAVDAGGKLVYENVQTLTAETNTTKGANLVLSKAVNAGGGTVWIQGEGATTVTYDNINKKIVISSSDTYGSTYSAGNGINIDNGTINAVDISETNEAQTLSAAGTTSPTINLSKVGSTGGGTVTLAATSPIKLAQSNNTITISSDASTNTSIADDVTLASSVYPIWAAGTGSQPLKISTTKLGFIPLKGLMTLNGMTVWGDATNAIIGTGSLLANTTGNNNIALGSSTLAANTIGTDNVAIGYQTLQKNIDNNGLTAVGSQALANLSSGLGRNVAVGFQALYSDPDGEYNTAVGYQALFKNDGGSLNTAIGEAALFSNTFGENNIAIGNAALYSNIGGEQNVAVGNMSLYNNTTGGDGSTAIGNWALNSNTTGSHNVAVGMWALQLNTSGQENTAVGYNALTNNTTVSGLTAVGSHALLKNTTGERNTAIGYNSLFENLAGADNVAVGYSVLMNNTSGSYNTAMGMTALEDNTTGTGSVAIGSFSLTNNTNGAYNTGIGHYAGLHNTTGIQNTAIGAYSLFPNQAGTDNVAIGMFAGCIAGRFPPYYGYDVVDISKSIYIGSRAVNSGASGMENEIVIGADAVGYGSHTINLNSIYGPKLYIGNDASKSQVYYEPLYFDQVGALGTVLAGQGTGIKPVWGQIALIQKDGIQITHTNGTLEWEFSVPCCAEIAGLKSSITSLTATVGDLSTSVTNINTSLSTINQSITAIQDAQAKCDCESLMKRITDLEALVGVHGVIQGEKSDEFTGAQVKGLTSFTLSQIPATTAVVKMYINGIRISNDAYLWEKESTKVNYDPTKNDNKVLVESDRVQFDYGY